VAEQVNPTEVMVDIETLDTEQSALVLSIGLLAFDRDGREVGSTTLYPSFDEQARGGSTISLGTVKFWAKTGGAAADAAMVDEMFRQPVRSVRDGLFQFYNRHQGDVWANGDLFDLGIITNLMGFLARDPLVSAVPWKYNSPRDLRTLMRECSRLGWIAPEARVDHVAHDALSDCRYQVDCLMSCRRFMQGKVGFRFDE